MGISVIVLIVAIVCSYNLKYGDANPGDPILWPISSYNTDFEQINQSSRGRPDVGRHRGQDKGKCHDHDYPDVMKGMEALK